MSLAKINIFEIESFKNGVINLQTSLFYSVKRELNLFDDLFKRIKRDIDDASDKAEFQLNEIKSLLSQANTKHDRYYSQQPQKYVNVEKNGTIYQDYNPAFEAWKNKMMQAEQVRLEIENNYRLVAKWVSEIKKAQYQCCYVSDEMQRLRSTINDHENDWLKNSGYILENLELTLDLANEIYAFNENAPFSNGNYLNNNLEIDPDVLNSFSIAVRSKTEQISKRIKSPKKSVGSYHTRWNDAVSEEYASSLTELEEKYGRINSSLEKICVFFDELSQLVNKYLSMPYLYGDRLWQL